jgi:plastocyanin
MRKILILAVSLTVLAIACGGDSSSGTPVKLTGNTENKGTKDLSGSSIDVEMDDFYFSPTFLKGGTPGSTVTVHLKNEGKNSHNFSIAGQSIDLTVEADKTADVQVTLPQSGATAFFCKFHQQSNGMQGAFFFNDGDAIAGAGGAPPSSSSSNGYDYN